MNPKLHYLVLRFGLAWCTTWLFATLLHAEETPVDRVSVPLRDPALPATVKAGLKSGGITVKGYDGKEVVVEARVRSRKSSRDEKTEEKGGGSKTIEISATRLTVEEENNVVTIGAGPSDRPIDLTIQVPLKASLSLGCMSDGGIVVEKVEGEIEASNQNGPVTLTNVAGVVVADSRNGTLLVQLSKVTPDKPMSFSTMTGDIDVTLPVDIKAKVKLETQNGLIKSDFALDREPRQPSVEDNRKGGGKYRVVFDNGVVGTGTINGGGAEISFKTVNGNIHIRKQSKSKND
jgi:DUF4097 and DUF4098 domain-containing protein YvlB